MKVGVLMGGPSGEHDISLKSGHGITEALRRRRIATEPLVIPRALTKAFAWTWVADSVRHLAPDVIFIAVHGTFGQDGTLQQLCEELHVPYTGSDPAASRLGMDKVASRTKFLAAGLQVPRWQVFNTVEGSVSDVSLPYPLVVKPISQGSSLGVSLVRTPEELPVALNAAGQYGAHVLIEEFVQGREVTVGIFGDRVLPVVEIRPHQPFFDFAAKYTSGMTDYLVPAPLSAVMTQQVQAAGLLAYQALGCRHLSRVDIIVHKNGLPIILEVNTIPGFTPTSLLPKAAACAGLSYEDVCEHLVMMAATHTEMTHV